MTTAEVNAAIAKAKGWTEGFGLPGHPPWMDMDAMNPEREDYHRNPTDDPREWSKLMLEMLEAGIDCLFCDDGSFEASRGYPGGPDAFCATALWKPSIGEAVCRTWLRWKGVSDA